jgi:DNA-binding response OmpR family regulator
MKKVLFVEDEFALQKSIGGFLEKEGYKIIKAMDGEEGLRLAKEELPDLILIDIILPKLDGLKVLEKIKEEEKTKSIPVIILTNLEGTENVQKALELGATTYLVKSNYTLEEIVKKVNKALASI